MDRMQVSYPQYHGVKESDSDEANAVMRSVLNDVHRKLFDVIILAMKPWDTFKLTHLQADDSGTSVYNIRGRQPLLRARAARVHF